MEITKEQRKTAVALAKDVLKRLDMKWYSVKTGTGYVCLDGSVNYREEMAGKDLKKLMPKLKDCSVCALGSLFLSWVMKNDKVKANYYLGLSTLQHPLEKAIGNQLVDIEDAFEQFHPSPRTVLRRIMKNIIRNKGVFTVRGKEHE
jgi:hypothetical protein